MPKYTHNMCLYIDLYTYTDDIIVFICIHNIMNN